jgi:hypothetical protein
MVLQYHAGVQQVGRMSAAICGETSAEMGLLISDGRVFDHLKRDFLPAEFRQWTYGGL